MVRADPGILGRAADAEPLMDEAVADDEPSKDEILDGIRLGLMEAIAGDTRPLDEVIAEIRQELVENADSA